MVSELQPYLPFLLMSFIVLTAGFVQSAIGFGYGITGLAMLPMVMDARAAHVLISVSGLPVLLVAAWTWRGEVEWKLIGSAMLGAIIFMPMGIWVFGTISLGLLVRFTGAAIIAMVLLSIRPVPQDATPTSGNASFWAGAVSGFLAGSVSIAGPPVATFAIRQSWSTRKFKGFVVQCLLLIAIFRTIGLAMTGFLTDSVLWQSAWAVPFAIVGVGLGKVATHRIDPDRFRSIVAVTLILVACQLLYRGSPQHDVVEPPSVKELEI